MMHGVLVLQDGSVFRGRGFGAETQCSGEVVFNTSMTGYPELCTDPSYRRQILTLTATEQGNYGVALKDAESKEIQVAGLLVRSLSEAASNWRSDLELKDWLAQNDVPGLCDFDTRALVHHIREKGATMGIVRTQAEPISDALCISLHQQAQDLSSMEGCALIDDVTCKEISEWTSGIVDASGEAVASLASPSRHVVAIDYGIKENMLRLLVHYGAKVTVVPARTSAEDILALKPDGVFLSNGPGDPQTADFAVQIVENLLGQVPVFGICMGHQILSQALGAQTYKTRFGHRSANQPVICPNGRILITSQNHGFAVSEDAFSAGSARGKPSHRNLSDQTNEGVEAPELFAFSVQYHPEASPGPREAKVHFQEFMDLMERFAEN